MTSLRLEAPAKLNLWLAVVGRRKDGYHLLRTEMVLLDLADRLLLMPGGSGLRVEVPAAAGVPTSPQRNLAWQGLLAGMGGNVPMACLALHKLIPAASGLGGGSSDAAAGWRLGRRWLGEDEAPTPAQLESLAGVGADVPFFASGTPSALVEGIGEQISPRPFPTGGDHVLLVHPPFPLSTAAVFAELRPNEWSSGQDVEGGNDLLAPALRLRPELIEVMRTIAAVGGRPQLTGSGPTLFVRSEDPERLHAIVDRLEGSGLSATRTRLRHEPASIEVSNDQMEGG